MIVRFGCSSWRGHIKECPETAKHDWEKELVKNK
jgi:hypothetical protein